MAAAAALGRKPAAFQPPRRQRRRTGRSLELRGCHSYSGGPLRERPTLAEALPEPREHPGLRARGPGSSVCQLGGIRAVATTAVVGRVPSGLPSVAWTLSSLCGRALRLRSGPERRAAKLPLGSKPFAGAAHRQRLDHCGCAYRQPRAAPRRLGGEHGRTCLESSGLVAVLGFVPAASSDSACTMLVTCPFFRSILPDEYADVCSA